MNESTLTRDEAARYHRQMILPSVGTSGQEKLKRASVLVVGAGGLGSPSALYLAAAGIGRLGIIDADEVDITNLHRQVIHSTSAVGTPKSASAAERLAALNPEVVIEPIGERLTSANALDILAPYDIVVDGSDNFPTRYLVNDAAVMLGKPNVYGSVFRFEGQASLFDAARGPCYRCLYSEPPPPGMIPSCEEGGVLGVVPGIIGLVQANEVVKLLLGIGEPLVGRLLLFDALSMRFREMRVPKNESCRMCGPRRDIDTLIDYEIACGVPETAAGEREEESMEEPIEITPRELAGRMAQGDTPKLIDVREPYEKQIATIEPSELIPLATLPRALERLNRDEEIVVYCRSGARSGRAVAMMRAAGFSRAKNLVGGVLRWSSDVDPSMPRY